MLDWLVRYGPSHWVAMSVQSDVDPVLKGAQSAQDHYVSGVNLIFKEAMPTLSATRAYLCVVTYIGAEKGLMDVLFASWLICYCRDGVLWHTLTCNNKDI